ncbi:MAG: M48 family metallopeptidase [Candidatus Fermentibacteraceae bacterium]|nr:M48 family metallopeptidase [Candidatus Fermentibacteraceae bacterium]
MSFKEDVRFAGDDPSLYGLSAGKGRDGSEMKRKLLTTAVKVIPELFPALSPVMVSVSKAVTGKPFELFVFSDASPKAYCLGNSTEDPTVLVSSGLIERFGPQEMAFVLGHELGHALFSHNSYPDPDDAEDPLEKLKTLALWRAREITADRAGLAATGDTGAAFRAMMKVASGLSDKFIRFDVTAFLDQVKDLEKAGPSPSFLLSTHPFVTARIRALLWFQMSEPWYSIRKIRGNPTYTKVQLEKKIKKEIL